MSCRALAGDLRGRSCIAGVSAVSNFAVTMRVLIPNPLRSYTGEAAAVSASGATLGELTLDLDRRFPGMRFFVIGLQRRDLDVSLQEADEVMIVCALSGG